MNINTIKVVDYYLGYLLIIIFWPLNFFINLTIKFIPNIFFKKNILFFKIVGGGSLLIAAPYIFAIKKKYPEYKITLFCSDSVAPFAKALNIFDDIYTISMNNPLSLLMSFVRQFTHALFSEYTINLEMHSKLASLLNLYAISRQRIALYLNYNRWQSNSINLPIFMNRLQPVFEGYSNIAHAMDCNHVKFSDFQSHFRISNNIKNKKRNYVVLAPFCSDIYSERELNPSQIKSIISKLKYKKNTQFIILGGKNDIEKSNQLEKELNKNLLRTSNQTGRTSIVEVIKILNSTKMLITIDSGILHIARLIGIKTLSYWGPSDPASRLFGSLARDKIVYKSIPCSPCVHILDRAPCRGNNLCIKQYFQPVPKNIFWHIR